MVGGAGLEHSYLTNSHNISTEALKLRALKEAMVGENTGSIY